ncbi:kelch-like protein 24a [Haliotis cracherodii]|uniref:kelch-like protein 24 n=1 Tax=Haliotis rufescens TaxID=6454 RepID=UPI001EAFF6A9|nr:kelch-like protein 24 [Haliotis rufescens]
MGFPEDEHTKTIRRGLSGLLNNEKFSDVIVTVAGREFKCHKFILSLFSCYFEAMFTSGMRESIENRVNLPDVNADVFYRILLFMYQCEDIVDMDTAQDVLLVASRLQIKCLQDYCEKFLSKKIGVNNCISLWRMSKMHNFQKMNTTAFETICRSFQELVSSESFNDLTPDELKIIIESDQLIICGEEAVADAVLSWVEADHGNNKWRKTQLSYLLEVVRLPLTTPEYLRHKVEQNDLVRKSKEAQDLVEEAKNFQMMPARRQDFSSPRTTPRKSADTEEVVFIIGGATDRANENQTSVYCYSFTCDEWYSLTNLPCDIGKGSAACVHGSSLFLTGGSKNVKVMYRYEKSRWIKGEAMPHGRWHHVTVAVGDRLYNIGGMKDSLDSESDLVACIDEYHISGERWHQAGTLAVPVHQAGMAVLHEKIFCFGGLDKDGNFSSAIQYFDVSKKTACQVGYLPSPLSEHLKAVTIDDDVYVISSQSEGLQLFKLDNSSMDVCNLVHVNLIQTINLPELTHFSVFQHEGNLYLVGGYEEGEGTSTSDDNRTMSDSIHIIRFPDSANAGYTLDSMPMPSKKAEVALAKMHLSKKYLKSRISVTRDKQI